MASRLYWAVGYHQPPTYFVPEWTLEGGDVRQQTSGRFRPELPEWKVAGDWSLHENPFVGTQPYRGLLVLHVITNSWDIKQAQNKIYEATVERLQPRRLYVVRDLGATFGRPRWPDGSRNNPEHYEEHPFIKGVNGNRVEFSVRGPASGAAEANPHAGRLLDLAPLVASDREAKTRCVPRGRVSR